MKTFRLILHDIKRTAVHNKASFFIVVISLTVTAFGVLFYSGYIYDVSAERRINYGDDLKIIVSAKASPQNIKDIVSKIESAGDVQSTLVSLKEPTGQNGERDIVGEYNTLYSNRILFGRYFERTEETGVMVLPEYYVGEIAGYNESPIGKTIEVSNSEITIVGVVSVLFTDYLVVPVDYYINNFQTGFIGCTYNNRIVKDDLYDYLSSNPYSNAIRLQCARGGRISPPPVSSSLKYDSIPASSSLPDEKIRSDSGRRFCMRTPFVFRAKHG